MFSLGFGIFCRVIYTKEYKNIFSLKIPLLLKSCLNSKYNLPFGAEPSALSNTNSKALLENVAPHRSSSRVKLYDLELLVSLPSTCNEKLTTICFGVLLFSNASFSNLSSISSPRSLSHFLRLSKSIKADFPLNCLQQPILFGLNLACTGSKSTPRAML